MASEVTAIMRLDLVQERIQCCPLGQELKSERAVRLLFSVVTLPMAAWSAQQEHLEILHKMRNQGLHWMNADRVLYSVIIKFGKRR